MKRFLLSAVLLSAILLSACAHVNVPPADYSENETETTSAATEPDASESTSGATAVSASSAAAGGTTVTETAVTSTSVTTSAASGKEKATSGASDETETETVTETTHIKDGPSTVAWAAAYEKLLAQKDRKSEHQDAYYALIRLNPDKVPELVILDNMYMELYCFTDGKAELLMEDAYKSNAVEDQNVCFQPIVGKLASYFSTMGGGTGFRIYIYEELDTLHVQRLCFDNNEDEGGEMPYNPIWDSAEEYEVQNNGWQDVTLGESWVHIGKEYPALYELCSVEAETLLDEWKAAMNGESLTEEEWEEEEEEEEESSGGKWS